MAPTVRPTVVVLGDANADLTLELGRWPRSGGDGQAADASWGSGGSALNVACALATLGACARLVACVGADPLAAVALAEARACGVELTAVERRRGARTGLCVVGVEASGERTFLSHRGANAALRGRRAVSALDQASLLHLSAYALLTAPQSTVAQALLEHADRRGVPVALDLGGPPARLRREPILAMAPSLSLLFGNEEEIASLDERGSLRRAVAALLARRVRAVAIKQGPLGCTIVRRARPSCWQSSPAWPADVRDTTACGDAFVAGYLWAVLRGAAMREAAAFANLVGALTAERFGAARSLPPRSEIAARAGRRFRALLERPSRPGRARPLAG